MHTVIICQAVCYLGHNINVHGWSVCVCVQTFRATHQPQPPKPQRHFSHPSISLPPFLSLIIPIHLVSLLPLSYSVIHPGWRAASVRSQGWSPHFITPHVGWEGNLDQSQCMSVRWAGAEEPFVSTGLITQSWSCIQVAPWKGSLTA